MKVGDSVQFAIWYCEEDDQEVIKNWRTKGCAEHIKASADFHNLRMGPVEFTEFEPGEANAGHPPDDRTGTNFTLLVAEAEVVGHVLQQIPSTFVTELTMKDLGILREVTRQIYAKNTAGSIALSDAGCDEIIDQLGPDTVEKMLIESINATKH